MPVQPCHGAQADHGRVSSCPPADHVPATPSSRSGLSHDPVCPSLEQTCLFLCDANGVCFSGEETEGLSRSPEVKSASPSDIIETTFTRKVGAFVNKPGTQVRTANNNIRHKMASDELHNQRIITWRLIFFCVCMWVFVVLSGNHGQSGSAICSICSQGI